MGDDRPLCAKTRLRREVPRGTGPLHLLSREAQILPLLDGKQAYDPSNAHVPDVPKICFGTFDFIPILEALFLL